MDRRSKLALKALGAGAAALLAAGEAAGQPVYAPYLDRTQIELRGTFRDFELYYMPGGHPDFGSAPAVSPGRYANIPGNLLDSDGKPVMLGRGNRVVQPRLNAGGVPVIEPRGYIDALPGDVPGSVDGAIGNAASDSGSYWGWFRNVPGINTTGIGTLRLDRGAGQDTFVFDGRVDRGGGLVSTPDAPANALYTYEVDTMFVFEEGSDWFFRVSGGGDAWVFIDDMLVIDAGAGSGFQGAEGIVADGQITVENTGDVWVAPGAAGNVCTNSTASGAVTVSNSAMIRADVYAGPGSVPATAISAAAGRISGTRGSLGAEVEMPAITAPAVGASLGDRSYTHHAFTLGQSFRCNNLTIETNAILNLQGSITIVCDGNFELRNKSEINLAPGATLDLYVRGSVFIGQTANFNVNTADPGRATIYSLGSAQLTFDNTADIYANIAAPSAHLEVGNAVHVRGNFIGRSFRLRNTGDFTITGGGGWERMEGRDAGSATQTIELARLPWLEPGRTYGLRLFYADRDLSPSRLRIETNINTLNIAAPPEEFSGD